jgi:hypothetical protein
MIEIYPSTLPGLPIETHDVHGVTLHDWLTDNVPGYRPGPEQPISATVAGLVIPPEQWPVLQIATGTVVELRVQPAGDPITWAVVGALVLSAASFFLKPSIPNINRSNAQQGQRISAVEAEANTPKLGDVIPELAGRHKRFPDYLCQPRRYFINPRTQALDVMLCIGAGEFDLPESQIRIGKTPMQGLGANVIKQVFAPGEDVTVHPAHRNWYNAPEVGASTGSAGLRLKAGNDITQVLDASVVQFDGASITVPAGAGIPPADWAVDMLLQVALLDRTVEVIDGGVVEGVYQRDRLRGQFADLALTVGDAITITGTAIAGDYLVHSIELDVDSSGYDELRLSHPDLTPVAFLKAGTYIVDMDYTGVRYRIDTLVTEAEVLRGWTVTKLLPNGGEDIGWPGFPAVTTSDHEISLDASGIAGGWSGPFLGCPEGEVTSVIEWDIFAPQGLGKLDDNGNIKTVTRNLELQYRELGADTWTPVQEVITANTRDQLGWTFSVNLPSAMTPEVRVRRIGAEDTSTQAMDRLEWYGLRSLLPPATSYPGVTTMALTLIGSDTIASQTENQISVVATRRLPRRVDGTWTEPVPTRDIAPWVAHIARSIGYVDSEIDLLELDRLDAIWQGRQDHFDFIVNKETTVKGALDQALLAGFAELTIDNGRIRPVRDEPRNTFEHMYTTQNMTAPLRRAVSMPKPDDADGVDVEYMDSDTWTKSTVECRLPGDEGRKVEKITLDGVTDRTRAWRIGMRQRRMSKYRRWKYNFSTELDALNSRYLSYCALGDDVPGYGQSAWIKGVMGAGGGVARLQVSEPLQWQDGADHVLAWRRPDGTLAGPYPATKGEDDFEVLVTMPQPWPDPDTRQEPPHILFGTTERWTYPALIRRINPQGMETVQVEAENYHPLVYADDDGSPP